MRVVLRSPSGVYFNIGLDAPTISNSMPTFPSYNHMWHSMCGCVCMYIYIYIYIHIYIYIYIYNPEVSAAL